jgi:alpha-D-xyloside xylohydrolase
VKKINEVVSLLLLLVISLSVKAGDFVRTDDGVIVHPDAAFSGNAKDVQLKVIADNIIRVIAGPNENLQPLKSLIITAGTNNAKFDIIDTKSSVTVKTSKLAAVVNLQTGSVSFYDFSGKQIVAEKELGRSIQPQVFDGEQLYSIRQDFITTPDDAWYGLGQHQDALMNYKTYQVQLFQNNTEVAVPFLVSRKNYGILWDNYSLTQFGDIRPYQQLSALKIFSKKDEQGWLTASYSNDKNDSSKVVVQRPESTIDLDYLNDSRLFLPKEFKPATGIATWEGNIASDVSGVHKFRFRYAGYLKVWIDDKLVLDRWRQNWNPGSAILDVDLHKGKKYAFKVEWIPCGVESYVSFHWLPPLTEVQKNSFSFSSEAGHQLDYYFIYGENMDSVISGYRALTGKAVMMPKWAFGFWQSRERYKTQDEILSTVAEFRKRKIPIDNIVQDWFYWKENEWGSQQFDPTRFPSPQKMISTLHDQYHTHFMISVWPKFYKGISTYNEFNKNGWLYKRNIVDGVRDWVGPGYASTFYDVFNKDARQGFWDLINKNIYSKGIDAWWMDASEPDILSNVDPQRRKEQMTPTALGPAALVLNAYPMENAKGIYEGQRQTNPDNRVFILTRSAFAGSQSYAAATWSGDIAARWADMKSQISAGVNFSMSGIPYWTMDIGGFAVESRYEKPNAQDLEEWREQMTRWYQFGAFVPLFRSHGQFPYREIFNVAPETHPAYQSILYYDKLRYRLLPYVYSLAGNAYLNNGSIMRGLVMDFPNDSVASNLNDQYLFGSALLINPVCTYKERARKVYLPQGCGWYDLYKGKYFDGGQKINAEAPYERMPVFVKAGSIIPFGPDLQYSSEKPADVITLYVYEGANGSFDLYEDEGNNYNYEKGAYSIIPIIYNNATRTLIIGDRKGSFSGMLQKRRFNIVWVTKDNNTGIDAQRNTIEAIGYSGRSVTIKKK